MRRNTQQPDRIIQRSSTLRRRNGAQPPGKVQVAGREAHTSSPGQRARTGNHAAHLLESVQSLVAAAKRSPRSVQILRATRHAAERGTQGGAAKEARTAVGAHHKHSPRGRNRTRTRSGSTHVPPLYLPQLGDDGVAVLHLQRGLGLHDTQAAPELPQTFAGQELQKKAARGVGGVGWEVGWEVGDGSVHPLRISAFQCNPPPSPTPKRPCPRAWQAHLLLLPLPHNSHLKTLRAHTKAVDLVQQLLPLLFPRRLLHLPRSPKKGATLGQEHD
jgi:hypothetical protein